MSTDDESLRAATAAASAAASELARAAALTRVANGAAHALAEAFGALLAETELLHDARKDEPEIDEACLAIREGLGRCARIARLLVDRRSAATNAAPGRESAGSAQTLDLGRVLVGAAPLLEHALSRRCTLALEEPDEPLVAHGDPVAVESLLVLVALHAESLVPSGPARLALRASRDDDAETVAIEAVVSGPALVAGAESSLAGASGPGEAHGARGVGGLTLVALHGVADAQRARLEIEREGNALKLRAVFPWLEEPA